MNWNVWLGVIRREMERQKLNPLNMVSPDLRQSTLYDVLGKKVKPRVDTVAAILAKLGKSFTWVEREAAKESVKESKPVASPGKAPRRRAAKV